MIFLQQQRKRKNEMTITDSRTPGEDVKLMESSAAKENAAKPDESTKVEDPKKGKKEDNPKNVFSDKNITSEEKVETDKPLEKPLNLGRMNKEVTITPEDKAAFIDSIVSNTRFTKNYSLFGGKVTLTIRSLTSDEVNALASWTIKQGSADPDGLTSGRYRKFLAAAQVSKLNGVEMPPLEEPLFEHLGSDGKTVEPPGWVNRFAYWEGMAFGLFSSVMWCLADFDLVYSALCRKAEDANFWNPDTP